MEPDSPSVTSPIVLRAGESDSSKRLDQFLRERLPQFSRSRLQEWIRAGRVRVNGSAQKPSYPLHGGELIGVEPAPLPSLRAVPEDIPLRILYEDPEVLAVDKPAGMVVHAGAGRHSGTLVNALLHHFGSLSRAGGEERPGIVHRLDRNTSGVILAARTDAAHRSLARQFAERQVEKVYLALVHGKVREDRGTIERPIARDPVRRVRMTTSARAGRAAMTEYRVLRRFRAFTLVELRIRTGRTHQIRVHMASRGHPVAGDTVYGAPGQVPGRSPLGRHFLHAHRIAFQHPSSGERVVVESPLPPELETWLAGLL